MPRRMASRKMSRSSVTASAQSSGRGHTSRPRVPDCGSSGLAPALWLVAALACLGHDPLGLIAELGGDLPVRGQHLGGSMNFFLVAGGVRGDLRGLRAVIAGLLARSSRICWRRGLEASRYSCEYPLISGAPLRPGLDLITEIAEPIGQF